MALQLSLPSVVLTTLDLLDQNLLPSPFGGGFFCSFSDAERWIDAMVSFHSCKNTPQVALQLSLPSVMLTTLDLLDQNLLPSPFGGNFLFYKR